MLQIAKAILLIVHCLGNEIIYYIAAHRLFRWLPLDVDDGRVSVEDLYQVSKESDLAGEDFIDQFALILRWLSRVYFTCGHLLWLKTLAHGS